jgi:hypothetical protein
MEARMRRLGISLLVMLIAMTLGSAEAASHQTPHKTVIKLGIDSGPLHIGAAFGSLWVTGHNVLYRIDPRTNAKHAIYTGNDLCGLPQFAAGYVWVGACGNQGTYQIDPRRNRVVRQLNTIGVAASGAGSLWFYDGSRGVVRLDPRSRVRLADISAGVDVSNTGGPFLVWDGFVWIYGMGSSSQTAISLIDVNTNKVKRLIPLPGGKPNGAQLGGYLWGGFGAVAGGKVWVTDPAGIYVIDPTNWTASLLPIKFSPRSVSGDAALVANGNYVWTRVSNGSVDELDASDGHLVRTYPATGGGGGLDVAYGGVWIANSGTDSVWRYALN